MSTDADQVGASVVRLRGVEADGSLRTEPVADLGERRELPGRRQGLSAGSALVVGPSPVLARATDLVARAWVFPTLPTPRPQIVMGTLDERSDAGWQLLLDVTRGLGLRVAGPGGLRFELFTGVPLPTGRWTEVSGSLARGSARLTQGEVTAEAPGPAWLPHGHDLLVVGAPHERRSRVDPRGNGCFNGKIAEPVVLAGAEPGAPEACRLDLSDAIGATRFADRSRHRLPVVVVNAPTGGVTGPRWRGGVSAFHQAREQYGAVHFHDDDLDDAEWSSDLRLDLPRDLPRGVYAARLQTSSCVEHLPFFVTDPLGPPSARAALLLPTLTYLAYANEHEIISNPASYTAFTGLDARKARLGWRDILGADLGLLSLYDVHRDGSSVVHASTRRPLLNLRPDYRWPLIEGPHGLAVDLALLAWLEDRALDVDLICDHDLDASGEAALAPYRLVITGAHPEYCTAAMLDALEGYVGAGGRLANLGGNGFYWVTGIDSEDRHRMEVRRGFAGTRPTSSVPGEAWLASTGEEGGLWRHRGRPPNRLTGVGFAAMGGGRGRPYRRTSAADDPAHAFVFEGVDDGDIGGAGTILGGAAAYEMDRADTALGTPSDGAVIATAQGFEELYYPVIEDFICSIPETADPGGAGVRADMVLLPKPGGGAVFSVGSAAWCGTVTGGGDGDRASRVTENVLRRFLSAPKGVSPLDRDPSPDGPSS